MKTTTTASLDRRTVTRVASALEHLSNEEADRLVAGWPSTIGVDLALARLTLTADERAVLDWSSEILLDAAWDRLRARWQDPIAASHGGGPDRLSELARGHLLAISCADRLDREQTDRLDAIWRRVVQPLSGRAIAASSAPNAASRRPENSARKQNSSR